MSIALKTVTVAPPPTRIVVFSLARFETRRALRHPLTWIGAVASLWLMWTLGGDVAPILDRDSVFLAGGMLPLATATLLVSNYAILRQRRLLETLDAYPSDANRRILGVQLGLIGPVLMAILLQTIGLVYLQVGGPIGTVNLWELAVGPLLIVVFGLGGVLLGRWLPHPIVAPVALVGLAALQFMASPDAQIFSSAPTANVEWLAPWMMPSAFSPIEELTFRPSVLHFGYLAVLALVLGILALEIRGRGRLAPLVVCGLFAIAVVVVSFNLSSEPTARFDWREAAANQVCSTADGIEYCAFEFYADWIPRWQETVASVNAVFPVTITKVMQRPPNIGWEDPVDLEAPGLVLANTHWDRDGATPYHRLDLALMAAQSAVGLPTTTQTRSLTDKEIDSIVEQNPDSDPEELRVQFESFPPSPESCSGFGQARTVVAVWMAASVLEDGPEALQNALTNYSTSESFRIGYQHFHNPSISIGRVDAELAQALLALSATGVRAGLESHWQEVIDPATTTAQLASWFGLPEPVHPDLSFYQEPCR